MPRVPYKRKEGLRRLYAYEEDVRSVKVPTELLNDLFLFIPNGMFGILVRRLIEKFLRDLVLRGKDAIYDLFFEEDMRVEHIVKSLHQMNDEELIERVRQIRIDRSKERPGPKKKAAAKEGKRVSKTKLDLASQFANMTPEEQARILKELGNESS